MASPLPIAFPPLRTEQAAGEAGRVLAKLERQDQDLAVFRVIAASEAMLRPFVKFAAALVASPALTARERELVILHLAARDEAGYEWFEHVPMARAAGVSSSEIESIRAGETFSLELTERERTAIRFAEAVVTGRAGEMGEAERLWAPAELVDLTLIAAWWGGLLPPVLAALGLDDLARNQVGELGRKTS
jgi:alkylhydroperoxidase family enzyme